METIKDSQTTESEIQKKERLLLLQRKDNKIAALEAKVKNLGEGLDKSDKNNDRLTKINKKL